MLNPNYTQKRQKLFNFIFYLQVGSCSNWAIFLCTLHKLRNLEKKTTVEKTGGKMSSLITKIFLLLLPVQPQKNYRRLPSGKTGCKINAVAAFI